METDLNHESKVFILLINDKVTTIVWEGAPIAQLGECQTLDRKVATRGFDPHSGCSVVSLSIA